MAIQIVPPKKEDSCYEFRARTDSNSHKTWLTYEIYPKKPLHRTLLLANGSYELLDPSEHSAYDNFLEHLGAEQGRKTEHAKSLVNRIATGSIHLPGVRVAIHRFGPVPVFVPERLFPIDFRRTMLDTQLALYPNVQTRTAPMWKSTETPEFVRSLNIGFGRIMQRYLEDVGQNFHDIEHHLGLREVFRRAKECETVLAESIFLKLRHAHPTDEVWKLHRSNKTLGLTQHLSCELFKRETDAIFSASFARIVALYLLNEFYDQIAIDSRSAHYREEFCELERRINLCTHKGFYDEALGRLLDVNVLNRAVAAYDNDDQTELAHLRADSEWAARFIEFSKFLTKLRHFTREFRLSPQTGRVFISYHHDVPHAEILKLQIESLIGKEPGSSNLRVLYFKADPGPPLRPSIKPLIWLADAVDAIILTQEALESAGTMDNGHHWIGLEAEHGLFLGKRLIFIVEEGVQLEQVINEFRRLQPEDLLSPALCLPDNHQRIDRLIDSLRDQVFAVFKVTEMNTSPDAIDPRVGRVYPATARAVVSKRQVDLLSGFFEQFPPQVRKTLVRIQKLVPEPKSESKKWLARKLSENWHRAYPTENDGAKAITNAWNLARARALRFANRKEYLLSLNKSHCYSGRLRTILISMNSTMTADDIKAMEQEILTRAS